MDQSFPFSLKVEIFYDLILPTCLRNYYSSDILQNEVDGGFAFVDHRCDLLVTLEVDEFLDRFYAKQVVLFML